MKSEGVEGFDIWHPKITGSVVAVVCYTEEDAWMHFEGDLGLTKEKAEAEGWKVRPVRLTFTDSPPVPESRIDDRQRLMRFADFIQGRLVKMGTIGKIIDEFLAQEGE